MTATPGLATVRDILAEIEASGAVTVEQKLNSLFDKFNMAARAIDPSITGAWVGYDAKRPNIPTHIVFERPGSDFLGPKGGEA
jgi:hypothetical protein